MTDDWPQIKARLEEMDEDHFDPNAIDAAVQRVENTTDQLVQAQAALRIASEMLQQEFEQRKALRQRVEELEEEKRRVTPTAAQEVWRAEANRQSKRAEAAERELADTKKHLNYYMGRTAQAEAKLARVVEAADDAYRYLYSPGFGPDTPKLPLVKVMANLESALAAAKGK